MENKLLSAYTQPRDKEEKLRGNLWKKGQVLLRAAHEYWKEYQKVYKPDAVVWLESTSGHMVLFTRGEYKSVIMKNIDILSKEMPLKDPFLE